MYTNAQIATINNAKVAREFRDGYLPSLVNAINASMNTAWGAGIDASLFFQTLGTDSASVWANNGKRIGLALSLGANYADITKPSVICLVCGDGNVVPSAISFPDTPLAAWGVPVANLAAANALIAAEATTPGTILAALVAAQPSS